MTGSSIEATLELWASSLRDVKPEGPARMLLSLIDANPEVVEETLARRAS